MSSFNFATFAVAAMFGLVALSMLSKGEVGAFLMMGALAAVFGWYGYSMRRDQLKKSGSSSASGS